MIGSAIASAMPDELTNRPGAYLLVIELSAPCIITLPERPPITLPPGCYGYCGSAYGPGGIRARVGHHLRPKKPARWHIDQLTRTGSVVDFRLIPGGKECDILQQLNRQAGVGVPIPGFGSTDCAGCPAHLVSLAAHIELPNGDRPGPPAPAP